MTPARFFLAVLIAAGLATSVRAADDPPITAVPATQPAAGSHAKVSPEAKELLNAVDEAYGKLKSLDVAGSVSVVIKIEGESDQSHSTTFTGSYLAPSKFRHDAKDDVLIGATGAKMYTFRSDKNAYTQADQPKDRVSSTDWPKDIAGVLGSQNPTLLLALSKSASTELLDEVATADKTDDTHIGDVTCLTLKLQLDDGSTMTAAFDPQTHLLKQTKTDVSAPLKKRRSDLSSA